MCVHIHICTCIYVDSVVYFTDRAPFFSSYCVYFYIRSHCIENKRDSVILAIVTASAFPFPPFFFVFSIFRVRFEDKEE